MTSKKILFIMHTPPPVHGAAMVGKYIKDNKNEMIEFGKNTRNKFLNKYTLQTFENNIISILSNNM